MEELIFFLKAKQLLRNWETEELNTLVCYIETTYMSANNYVGCRWQGLVAEGLCGWHL